MTTTVDVYNSDRHRVAEVCTHSIEIDAIRVILSFSIYCFVAY